MTTKNIECQLAIGQISRYLTGGPISPTTLSQLEEHISECTECRQYLIERREALQNMLTTPSVPAYAVAAVPVSDDEPEAEVTPDFSENKKQALMGLFGNQVPTTQAPAKKLNLTKPAGYATALALVLVGMSYASRTVQSMMSSRTAEPVAQATSKPAPAAKFISSGTAPIPVEAAPATAQPEVKKPVVTQVPAAVTPTARVEAPVQVTPFEPEPHITRKHRTTHRVVTAAKAKRHINVIKPKPSKKQVQGKPLTRNSEVVRIYAPNHN